MDLQGLITLIEELIPQQFCSTLKEEDGAGTIKHQLSLIVTKEAKLTSEVQSLTHLSSANNPEYFRTTQTTTSGLQLEFY